MVEDLLSQKETIISDYVNNLIDKMLISSCASYTNRNHSTSLPNVTISYLNASISSSSSSNISDGEWIVNSISLIIFVLALLGNTAALLVMFGSRGPIRLTNNKYLVNLACADLLRTLFTPFTIIARMKRNFMFGPIICKILPIVQGSSVAVGVFTLVCISVERYIAICRPLLILKLQSLRFANFFNGLILFLIWTLGLLTALPNISMYNLCSFPKLGTFKCIKVEPNYFDGRVYMVMIDVFYFLTPMLIMLVLYTLIICKMYKNNTAMRMRSFQNTHSTKTHSNSSGSPPVHHKSYHQIDLNDPKASSNPPAYETLVRMSSHQSSNKSRSGLSDDENPHMTSSWPKHLNNQKRRRTNRQLSKERKHLNNSRPGSHRSRSSSTAQCPVRMDRHRRKALKLLIVIIVEFFICWTPLFIYHTIGTFDKNFHRSMPTIIVDLILLFSFASLLTNPFTYYFMSKRYRVVLYAYLSCCFWGNDKQKFNKKHQDAKQVVKALRLHQQQNSPEYKQKIHQTIIPTSNHVLYHPKFRSNTVQ